MNRKIITNMLIGLLLLFNFIMATAFGEFNQKNIKKDEKIFINDNIDFQKDCGLESDLYLDNSSFHKVISGQKF